MTNSSVDKITREQNVLTVSPEATAHAAARVMRRHEIGCLVVTDGDGIVQGILTERDIVKSVVAKAMNPEETLVKQIMTFEVVYCGLDTSISKAQQIMAEHGIRHLPIIEEGAPVGMISSRDILAHQLSAVKAIARKQRKVLQELEKQHPGITQLEVDNRGRVVI